jgi:Na+/H+ antiporter NhaB
MSYTITLTNRIDQGQDTNFKCLLPTPITIKKNSYIQLQNAYLEKANIPAIVGGIYVVIPQFASGNSFWLNQDHNYTSGMIGCITNFPNVGTPPVQDDKLFLVSSYPKIALNNSEMVLQNLDVELRDRTNAVIDPTTIENVSITISITDNPVLLS